MLSKMTLRVVGFFLIASMFLLIHYKYHKPSFVKLGVTFAKKTARYALSSERPDYHQTSVPEVINGKKVILRKFAREDFDAYKEALGNKEVRNMFFFGNKEGRKEINIPFYLHNQLMDQFFGERIIYTVLDKPNGVIGGMIELVSDKDASHGHVSGWANPQFWGTGQAAETIELAVSVFFNYTSHDEIKIFTTSQNQRCVNFLTKQGFLFKEVSQARASLGDLVFYMKREAKITKNA